MKFGCGVDGAGEREFVGWTRQGKHEGKPEADRQGQTLDVSPAQT